TNLEVKSVKRECVDGTLRKTYDVYGEKHFDSGYMESHTYTIVEGVGVTGSFDGLFCFPYVEDFVGEPYPEFEEVVLNYSTGVEELFDTDAAGSLTLAQGAGVVTVGGAVGEVTAAIYALDGVKLAEALGNGSATLSTYELPIGIYVVKATDSTGNRLTQKIVVK
ncbi:MAG: T9SS type A sorting domain-containing protein, partial [Muribaculaceae bacterium]|nr:T9SS type A sorting domain-containing protein [Muribaculaceae bacterium]